MYYTIVYLSDSLVGSSAGHSSPAQLFSPPRRRRGLDAPEGKQQSLTTCVGDSPSAASARSLVLGITRSTVSGQGTRTVCMYTYNLLVLTSRHPASRSSELRLLALVVGPAGRVSNSPAGDCASHLLSCWPVLGRAGLGRACVDSPFWQSRLHPRARLQDPENRFDALPAVRPSWGHREPGWSPARSGARPRAAERESSWT